MRNSSEPAPKPEESAAKPEESPAKPEESPDFRSRNGL